MPNETTNLKLKLYDPDVDGDERVYDFLKHTTGYTNSNLTKIDDAIGEVKEGYLPLAGGTMTGKIIGDLDGNASSATKAVQDGDGNVIATTYPKISANAGFHNSVYRGADITSKFTSGTLFANISNETFEDLFIGDYFTATCNGVSTNWRLAGFDIYYNCGDTALTRHHAVVIPDHALLRANMNADHVTTGSYVGSRMYTETIPDLATKIGAMVGTDHLVKYRDLLAYQTNSSATSGGYGGWSGASSSWGWYDTTVRLCNEVDVYGTRSFSSSGYDVGMACVQLPLFSLNPALRVEANRDWWWLSAVSDSGDFCNVGSGWASNVAGVRPRFLIG